MDAHLITKIIHMSAVSLLLIASIVSLEQQLCLLDVRDNQQPNTKGSSKASRRVTAFIVNFNYC